jgi:hypothetical protein
VAHRDQTQADRVRQIIVELIFHRPIAREHRRQDPAYARLAQPSDQGVEMGVPLEDDRLLGGIGVRGRDGYIAIFHVPAHDLVREGVRQPWVPLAELPDPGAPRGFEALPGRFRVLPEEAQVEARVATTVRCSSRTTLAAAAICRGARETGRDLLPQRRPRRELP